MTTDQVVQHLRALRYGRPLSINAAARQAGLHRETLYRAIRSGSISAAHAEALTRVFQADAKGRGQNLPSPPGR